MERITIPNRCHRLQGFGYHPARFTSTYKSIEISVRKRKVLRPPVGRHATRRSPAMWGPPSSKKSPGEMANGLLNELTKAVLERALSAELTRRTARAESTHDFF